MISKLKYLLTVTYCMLFLVGNAQNNKKKNVVYDLDSIPVFILTNTTKDLSIIEYIEISGEKHFVDEVNFKYGKDSLETLIEKAIFNQSIHIGLDNFGISIFYYILLDVNLQIKEIRIGRIGINRETKEKLKRLDYAEIIHDALIQTNGSWVKKNKCLNKWRFYMGRIKI
jgi:hypothetical protein